MKTGFVVLVVIVVITGILLAGLGLGGSKVGDVVVAKQDIQLTDGDQETCVLPKGEKVTIRRIDTEEYGSSVIQKLYMVESTKYSTCWGFALAEYFK